MSVIRGTTITTPIARSAVADDNCVSSIPWSSKNTVDKLCPSFSESGTIVTCEPVEGYPLEVEWQTKNLCTIDSIDTAVTAKETNLFSGNLKPPLVISADVSQITAPTQAGLVNAVWSDGTSTAISLSMLNDGYVCTNKVLTALQYKNWCNATGTAKIQVEAGTQKTAYEPYAETATITRCGKNIAQPPFYGERTANGITVTPHADGKTFTINGTATADATYYLYSTSLYGKKWDVKNGADYTLSVKKLSGSVSSSSVLVVVNYYPFGGNNMRDWMNVRLDTTNRTKSCPADLDRIGAYIYVASGVTCTDLVISYQLESGNTATDHEQYRESQTFAVGEPITALPGGNTIYADAGLVTVTGKANPSAIIEKLTNQVNALSATMAALTGV